MNDRKKLQPTLPFGMPVPLAPAKETPRETDSKPPANGSGAGTSHVRVRAVPRSDPPIDPVAKTAPPPKTTPLPGEIEGSLYSSHSSSRPPKTKSQPRVLEATAATGGSVVARLHFQHASLQKACVEGQANAGLFLAGTWNLTLGTAVLLRIVLDDLPTGVELEGAVVSRKAEKSGQPGGIGIRVSQKHLSRLEFLRNWSMEDVGIDRRKRSREVARWTLLMECEASWSSTYADVVDVSASGIRISSELSLRAGQTATLRVLVPTGVCTLAGIVVWSNEGEAGLSIVPADRNSEEAWKTLVSKAESDARPKVSTRV